MASCQKETYHHVSYTFTHQGDGNLIVNLPGDETVVLQNDTYDTAYMMYYNENIKVSPVTGGRYRIEASISHKSSVGESSSVTAELKLDGVVLDSYDSTLTDRDCYSFYRILSMDW